MVYAGILVCFITLLFSWRKLRDIIAPPFIISAIWLAMYIILLFRKNTVDLSSGYYSSFFIGLVFFVIGFFFVVRNQRRSRILIQNEEKREVTFNISLMRIIIFLEIVLFIFFLAKVSAYIKGNFSYNFWQTLSIGRGSGLFKEGAIISYSRNAIISFAIVCSIAYFHTPQKRNRNYFIISVIIALFFTVTGSNRGIIFMLLLAIFFSNIIIKNYRNKKVAVILFSLVAVILVVFIVFAFMKYVYEDRSDTVGFIMKQLRIYFSTSMIAFVEWIKVFQNHTNGTNTFRFFAEILNAVGYNFETTRTVQNFVIVYGDATNVYTVLQYYASDYGLVYAFIIQAILGGVHGYIYKKSVVSHTTNPFYIALQSILYYPLIYQFFSDQYFTILSTWVQFIFWFWLFTKKGFLMSRQKQ